MTYGITDRLRFTIINVNTNQIVARDLVVVEPEVMISLSAPSHCMFKVPQTEQYGSAAGINWKTWGQWIVPEIEIAGVRKCLGAQIVNKCTVDPKTGDMTIEGLGFMGYPKGIPWLDNYNPVAVDPATVIQRIWSHCQNFTNANLEVDVLPASTGTEMLPGYSYDGTALTFDFFAIFVRETDFNDCGDYINSLARDIPLDMVEEVSWNTARNNLTKVLRLGYPYLGYRQDNLSFVLGENVISVEKADEIDIEPVTDIIIRSWRPGKAISSQLSNNDQTRLRRVVMEEDANIDSTERAAAWAKRKLTRRNIPNSFKKISIDPSHPNAPLGNFGLGDSIYVEAKNYPWFGDIAEWHRITSMTFKDNEPIVELGLRVEGAFNYDPITYDPNYAEQPTSDLNLLTNGYFSSSTAGWYQVRGQWFRIATLGYNENGCIRVDCDDDEEFLESHKVNVTPGKQYKFSAWVKREDMVFNAGNNSSVDGIYIAVKGYTNGTAVTTPARIDGIDNPDGTGPWKELKGYVTIPSQDVSVLGKMNQVTMWLCVTNVVGGKTWWDGVRIDPL